MERGGVHDGEIGRGRQLEHDSSYVLSSIRQDLTMTLLTEAAGNHPQHK